MRTLVHGTETGYCDLGCRCDECREAHTWAERQRQRKRGVKPRPPLRPCGTRSAYVRHRRRGEPICDACRQANSDYLASHRALTGRR